PSKSTATVPLSPAACTAVRRTSWSSPARRPASPGCYRSSSCSTREASLALVAVALDGHLDLAAPLAQHDPPRALLLAHAVRLLRTLDRLSPLAGELAVLDEKRSSRLTTGTDQATRNVDAPYVFDEPDLALCLSHPCLPFARGKETKRDYDRESVESYRDIRTFHRPRERAGRQLADLRKACVKSSAIGGAQCRT